jgi:hypothetical protein
MCRRLARRSRSFHILSEKRMERGVEPSGRDPLRGLPRRAFSKARALRKPAGPRPSTTAFEKSNSGMPRSDVLLGSEVRLFLPLLIALPFISGGFPCTHDTYDVIFEIYAHHKQNAPLLLEPIAMILGSPCSQSASRSTSGFRENRYGFLE